jgi:hypothetical protein
MILDFAVNSEIERMEASAKERLKAYIESLKQEKKDAVLAESEWWAANTIVGGLHGGKFSERLAANRAAASQAPRPRNCPTCNSPQPKLHPAVQWEGEVQPCADQWHAASQAPPAGSGEGKA